MFQKQGFSGLDMLQKQGNRRTGMYQNQGRDTPRSANAGQYVDKSLNNTSFTSDYPLPGTTWSLSIVFANPFLNSVMTFSTGRCKRMERAAHTRHATEATRAARAR